MIYLVFIGYFLVTLIVEGGIILLWFRNWIYVYYSFLCNLATNPAVNLLLLLAVTYLGAAAYYPVLIILEITTVVVEAFILRLLCDFKILKAFYISLILNISSFVVGYVISLIFF